MITDRIKWDRRYTTEVADRFSEAQIEVEGTDREKLFRTLTNIADETRVDKTVVDIQFEDDSLNDPHLFDKAQFYYDTTLGERIRCHVICFEPPKDDRSGRLAFEGTAFDKDGNELYTLVYEFLVGVPDHKGKYLFAGAVTVKDGKPAVSLDDYSRNLLDTLQKLAVRVAK